MTTTKSMETVPEQTPVQHATTHLQIHAPEAQSVFVADTFNDWRPDATPLQPQASGLWMVELELEPGLYAYRFVVDGVWCSDPDAQESEPNPFGDQNAVLRVA